MIGVITAVLAGSTAALAAILVFDHSLGAALIAGAAATFATKFALIRFQGSAWADAYTAPLSEEADEGPS